jgi:hypothetical protein
MRTSRWVAACILVALATVLAGATGAEATDDEGYIGCSMTLNGVEGYRLLGGTGLWPTLGYKIDGGILGRWSTTTSTWWTEYDQQTAQYGLPPSVLLLMVCAGKGGTGVSNSIMTNVLGIAQTKAPGAVVVVLGQPEYEDGHLCRILGNNLVQQDTALAKVRSAVAHAVTLGAEAGPVLPELGPTTTKDGCHANTTGKQLLGEALLTWEASR